MIDLKEDQITEIETRINNLSLAELIILKGKLSFVRDLADERIQELVR